MDKTIILKTTNLTKKYGDFTALNEVNIKLNKGTIYGLIGRNGAGKTTLLKLINKQLFSTSGSIETSSQTSLSKDFQSAFKNMRIKDLFALAKMQYPQWNHQLEKDLITTFNVPLKKMYEKISRGNQNLISIIITLCSNVDLLLFDEPYTGLDPVNRELLYQELIRQNIEEDKTIILSSHLVAELSSMIGHVIMVDKGRIALDEDMDTLKSRAFEIIGKSELVSSAIQHKNIIHTKDFHNQTTAHILDELSQLEIQHIRDLGCQVNALSLHQLIVSLSTEKGGSSC